MALLTTSPVPRLGPLHRIGLQVLMTDMEAADGCPGKYTVGLGQVRAGAGGVAAAAASEAATVSAGAAAAAAPFVTVAVASGGSSMPLGTCRPAEEQARYWVLGGTGCTS